MTKYKITRRDEETECSYCAYPLMIDDTAYMSKDERSAYCSKACAGVGEPKRTSMIESSESAAFGKRTPKGVRVGCFDV